MFLSGPVLASARLIFTPLLEERGFEPDLDAIDPEELKSAKLLVISYPANPIGRLAREGFFETVVAFAKKHNLIVIHDNAYSELTFDGRTGGSFLQAPGAIDVGVELNSLSKSYNLTGCRVSFAIGRPDIIDGLRRLKSNLDYGLFRPVQKMAIAALNGPQDCLTDLRRQYQSRRDTLVSELGRVGWEIQKSEGTMFVWAKLPDTAPSSWNFTMELLKTTGVVVVPGITFGDLGDRYVRFALTQPEEILTQACVSTGEYLDKIGHGG
jgi:LL-diaminopimelate aminotransferase